MKKRIIYLSFAFGIMLCLAWSPADIEIQNEPDVGPPHVLN
ncbi:MULTISPECIES: hypothetical protein [Sporosarcina]|uniref:Phosphatase n=1 Tax=Sporosarcina contaminans TaxID=633403 RepID=A0ABW3U1G4_9BACL